MPEPEIRFDHFTYTYPDTDKPALLDVDLSISQGEVVMITGPAGAGKTTLCSCVNGLIPHYYAGRVKGHVFVKGRDTMNLTLPEICSMSGTVLQDPENQLICPSVGDEVAFGPENYGIDPPEIDRRVKESLKMTRLEGLEDRNPHLISGGQQQACAIAAIMATRPSIYVLDEPTSNLDPFGSAHVLNIILDLARSENKTMIVVEHKIEALAPYVDRIILMDQGRIIDDGKPYELLQRKSETMDGIGLKPPQSTLVALRLLKKGHKFAKIPVTVEEAIDAFSRLAIEGQNDRKAFAQAASGTKSSNVSERDSGKTIIEVEGLTHIYERGPTVALKGINLTIREGEFVGIIGQNGSGKTTLVKHFNGLLKPTSGRVLVKGIDTRKAKVADLSRMVGYVFQNPDHMICNNTVKSEIEFGLVNLGIPVGERAKLVRESAKRLDVEYLLNKSPFSLSKGERQRTVIAAVLAMKPDVLVVDEPTVGQDYMRSKIIMDIMKELNEKEGKTIVVITHDMDLAAEYLKRTVVLRDGAVLLDGPTREVFSQVDTLSTTSLRPPQVMVVSKKLGEGFPSVLTVDEMCEALSR